MQIWRHPGKHHLCFFCWDNQSGSHSSGRGISRWGWPDCSSAARDPRTGPDVNNLWGKKMVEEPYPGTLSAPTFPVCHCPEDAGGEVNFVTPGLGPISAVNTCVTQVTDLGVSWITFRIPELCSWLRVSPAHSRGRRITSSSGCIHGARSVYSP